MRLVPASARAPQAAGVQSEYLPGVGAQLYVLDIKELLMHLEVK